MAESPAVAVLSISVVILLRIRPLSIGAFNTDGAAENINAVDAVDIDIAAAKRLRQLAAVPNDFAVCGLKGGAVRRIEFEVAAGNRDVAFIGCELIARHRAKWLCPWHSWLQVPQGLLQAWGAEWQPLLLPSVLRSPKREMPCE